MSALCSFALQKLHDFLRQTAATLSARRHLFARRAHSVRSAAFLFGAEGPIALRINDPVSFQERDSLSSFLKWHVLAADVVSDFQMRERVVHDRDGIVYKRNKKAILFQKRKITVQDEP